MQTKWLITAIKKPLYLLINTINRSAQRVGAQQNTTQSGTTQHAQHGTAQYDIQQQNTPKSSATQCNTTRHSLTRHGMAQHFKEQHGITWHDDTTQYIKEPLNKTRYSTRSQRAAWHNTAPHAQHANERHGTTQHVTKIGMFLLAQCHLYVHKATYNVFHSFLYSFIPIQLPPRRDIIHLERANHLIIRPGSHHTFFTNNYQQKIPKVWVRWLISQLCSL